MQTFIMLNGSPNKHISLDEGEVVAGVVVPMVLPASAAIALPELETRSV